MGCSGHVLTRGLFSSRQTDRGVFVTGEPSPFPGKPTQKAPFPHLACRRRAAFEKAEPGVSPSMVRLARAGTALAFLANETGEAVRVCPLTAHSKRAAFAWHWPGLVSPAWLAGWQKAVLYSNEQAIPCIPAVDPTCDLMHLPVSAWPVQAARLQRRPAIRLFH